MRNMIPPLWGYLGLMRIKQGCAPRGALERSTRPIQPRAIGWACGLRKAAEGGQAGLVPRCTRPRAKPRHLLPSRLLTTHPQPEVLVWRRSMDPRARRAACGFRSRPPPERGADGAAGEEPTLRSAELWVYRWSVAATACNLCACNSIVFDRNLRCGLNVSGRARE